MDGVFQFAPSTAGDWATYAGFDRKTGAIAPSRFEQMVTGQGVAPPQNMTDLISQTTSGIQQKFQNLYGGAQQIGQGNVLQGVRQVRGAVAPGATPVVEPTQPVQAPAPGTPGVTYKYSVED